MFKRYLAFVLAIVLLTGAACLAEEPGGADLYSPEVYAGEQAVEAALPEAGGEANEALPMAAAAPGGEGPMAAGTEAATGEPVPQAMAAPMGLVQVVALTERKASVQMSIYDALQIAVGEGEAGTFASKTPGKASVDAAGRVTPLAKGKAKIEFRPDGGKKRTLTIDIIDPYEPKSIGIAQGKTVTINVGESLQLGAVLAPETAQTALTWSSNKAKVATVDAYGLVAGWAEGKAKITVRTDNKKKATITVTVRDPYKPSGVSIAQGGAITLYAGQSVRLNAGLIPESAVSILTWSSSKAKVATVDGGGLVTALAKGKATITVRTANGKKAKCRVTVQPGNAPDAPVAPAEPETPVAPVTPVAPEGAMELIDYLKTRDQAYALASALGLSKWDLGPDAPVIAVYGSDDVMLQIENRHDYFLTVFASSNGRYSLDGVTTTMRFDEAAAALQSRGWAYGFAVPAYDENGVERGTNHYYEKNVSNDDRRDNFVLTTTDGVSLTSITVAIEDDAG